MIRPPSSHVPPPGNQSMFQPQSANKLSQQMQGLNLGPSSPQHPGMSSYASHPDNQQMVPGPPTLNNQQFPSPLRNKSQISTNVTYSTQPKATYPYLNNNPPGNVGIQQNMNNNQYSPSNTFPGQVTMSSSPMSPQAQNGNKSLTNPVQAYSPNPTSINSPNYSNGISNGHEDSKQPWNAGLQSYQSPHPMPNQSMPQSSSPHQGQVQYLYGTQNRNLQPQQNVSTSPLTNTGPPVQHYMSPNSEITQSPGHNVMNNQSLPPIQPGYQYPSQPSNMSFPPNMSSPPTSPVSFPPGPQQYHGMPPNQPSPQFPGMTPQSPSNYPYGASSQGQQQPPKIDLDQMPNTVQVRQEDKNLRSGYYSTDVKGQCPPLVTTNFIVQDRGMCSPRFIRSTVYCLPNNPDVLKQTAIPFAITVSPLAAIHDGEREPPACLYREQGPLRCKRCKAYVCSFMTFMEGGRCFQCAFCKVVTEVPQDYFCFLDGLGERTDKYHRPELCLGSYEFPATKEYCRKDELPNPPAYIFMIEVSNATFRNGLVPLFCENLKNILQCLQNDKKNDTSKLRVGFVTYNNVLHFYNLK
ncbi:protein transport protein Sec24D-like, partial [Stegodyphus dumicola]|uniref:protein transport protein Sec24D-like n=1 Tax=Stegodyphus dumicola TaxID=202533 RepID=UPI0015AEB0F3